MARQEVRQIRMTRHLQNRQVATIDHVRAVGASALDEPAELRVQLGRAAGDVELGNAPELEHAKAGVDDVGWHDLRAVRSRIHVAVAARLVAQLADVDLQRPDAGGPQRIQIAALQRLLEALSKGHLLQRLALLGRLRQGMDSLQKRRHADPFERRRARTRLHGKPVQMVAHLHAVHQCRATANGGGDVHRLGHLLEVGTLLEAGLRVRVDAVGALHRM